MTEKEARQIFFINKEIEQLKIDLKNLEDSRTYCKALTLSGIPSGRNRKKQLDEFMIQRQQLEEMIKTAIKKRQKESIKFNKFLETIEDSEIRLILRLRCIENQSWEEIGQRCSMDRRTASRKYYGFFRKKKVAHNAHNRCDKMISSGNGRKTSG